MCAAVLNISQATVSCCIHSACPSGHRTEGIFIRTNNFLFRKMADIYTSDVVCYFTISVSFWDTKGKGNSKIRNVIKSISARYPER